MKTFVTSDLHFDHKNILKFNPATRPFRDMEHMNAEMIREWNERVAADDLVYILGDVAFCNPSKATAIVRSLNGRKILIQGNHDKKLVADANFRACFEEIHVYHEVNCNGVKVCFFHYPIAEWNQCHRGSVHLHGHLHGAPSGIEQWRALDAGMDATGEIVVELGEMVRRASQKPARGHGSFPGGDV